MSHEIYYTSAPEGMKRGTSGFCTVGATDNIPKPLWDRLETLSAYRHQFGINAEGGANAGGRNPVSAAHWILSIAGKTSHVLSRICDSGVDHTQRTNAFAHHLVLEQSELEAAPAGPAWMLAQPGVMTDTWDGRVGTIGQRRLPAGSTGPQICHAWAAATGDAGWGGHLAEAFAKSPNRPVCILFSPGQELLPLIEEAIALLPAAARWNVTFNTYFTSMPTSATCLWRCCLAGTPAAQVGLRYAANGLVLDLTDRSRLPALADSPYVTMARTGRALEAPSRAAAPAAKAPLAPRIPARESAPKPAPPPPVYDPEDEEELAQAAEFNFAVPETDPAEYDPPPTPDLATEVASHAAEMAQQRSLAKGPRRPIKRADEALREAEAEADASARRRRKQIMALFFAALGAIAVGGGLVYFAKQNISPKADPIAVPPTQQRVTAAVTVEDLLNQLDSKFNADRIRALTALTALPPDDIYRIEVIEKALAAIENSGGGAGAAATDCLKKWMSPELYPRIMKQVALWAGPLRQPLFPVLGAMKTPEAAAVLAKQLNIPDDVQTAAAQLGLMGPIGEQALIPYLSSGVPAVSRAVLAALENNGSEVAIAAILASSAYKDQTTTAAAQHTIDAIRDRLKIGDATGPVIAATQSGTSGADSPPIAAARYPDLITLSSALTRPNLAGGIGDRTQTMGLRAADLDPAASISGLRILFPASSSNRANRGSAVSQFGNERVGTITATESKTGRPSVSLSWKPPGESALEGLIITFDRTRPGLDFQWRSAALVRKPQMLNLLYWVVQNSTLELTSPRAKPQCIVQKPFEPGGGAGASATGGGISLALAAQDIAWPVELPADVSLTPPDATQLPKGWEATWYTDWETKDAALRAPENASQVIKLKKPTSAAVVDAWFLITFRPGFTRVESTFAKRLAADQAEVARYESELRAIDTELEKIKQINQGVIGDSQGARDWLEKRKIAAELLEAYKAAVAGYEEIRQFDIGFDIPDSAGAPAVAGGGDAS